MRCDLVDNHGYLVDSPVDQEVEFRFNLMLDSLEDWKQSIDKGKHELFSLSGISSWSLGITFSVIYIRVLQIENMKVKI